MQPRPPTILDLAILFFSVARTKGLTRPRPFFFKGLAHCIIAAMPPLARSAERTHTANRTPGVIYGHGNTPVTDFFPLSVPRSTTTTRSKKGQNTFCLEWPCPSFLRRTLRLHISLRVQTGGEFNFLARKTHPFLLLLLDSLLYLARIYFVFPLLLSGT